MESGAIARFGGITAYGDQFHGTGFHLVDMVGWTDSPDVNGESVRRPAAHGLFVLPLFLDERTVRLSGFHVANSHQELEHAGRQLRGLITRRLRLTVEDARGTLWADATVTAATFRNNGFAAEAAWSLTVTCEDSRIYGETREFAAGVAAVHYGNFPSTPVHEVTGTTSGYTITGPDGRAFTVSSGPGSGVDRIDMASGRVYRNGSLLLGAVTRADLWTIPPGGPGVTHAISAGSLTTTVTDTFV